MTFTPQVLIVESTSSLTFVLSSRISDQLRDERQYSFLPQPAIDADDPRRRRQLILSGLKRELAPPQVEVVLRWAELLSEERTFTVEGQVGCGQTAMAIGLAAVLHAEIHLRTLILAPLHLVCDWQRQILLAIPNATVCQLRDSDAMAQLSIVRDFSEAQDFYIVGSRCYSPVLPCSIQRIGI
jgi:hypothetical protein